jgi:hypothetical protein
VSSRPLYQPAYVIGGNSGVSGSLASSITSAVTVLSNLSTMSYSYSWTGTSPVGTIAVQVSNDYSQNADGSVNNTGTWNSLPLSSIPAISGNTGTGLIDIDITGAYAIRTTYTAASGTGTLSCVFKGKVQ